MVAVRLAACAALLVCTQLEAREPDIDPARRTPTVRLIERCLPAVVAIRAFSPTDKPNESRINLGSGSIVHPAGYILTNQHVVQGATRGEAVLSSGEVYPYRLIAALAQEDMAVVKIEADHPLPVLPLGRSHDLLLGEPVVAIGNPVGLASSVSEGIVSGLKRSTSTEHAFLPTMIQTNAAISGGSSGGPLINALGEQIGLVTSRKADAENIAFAIAADRVREMWPTLISAEQRYNFQLGLQVDMVAPRSTIQQVVPDSPAATTELRAGDVVTRLGDQEVRCSSDFWLALVERKAGQEIVVTAERGKQAITANVKLAGLRLPTPVEDKGLEPGLRFATYQGEWTRIPDFASLTPVEQGTAERPNLTVYKSQPDNFGLAFSGFVKVPSDGLYTFSIRSDDGSRLYLSDRLLVDNDGAHPPREAAAIVRLAAGLYPLKVEYFEAGGDQELAVFYEGPGVPRQELPAAACFHRAEK